jgi:O-antigen/teichoic acid export membrane protein
VASLRDKTISGIFWSFLQKIGSRGISFLVTIFLARLLAPKDFGLIGMLMIFIQVSQAIINGGFKPALIQKKEIGEEEYSSVFYINLSVGIFFYLLLYFTAPLISKFYEQPLLTSLTRTLSLIFIFNAFSLVQESKLAKELKFKTLMLISIPSIIIGGIVSVIMAFNDCGVWSIVALQLVSRFLYGIQIWTYSKWKPLLIFDIGKVKILFAYGSRLLISEITTTLYNNIYLVLIGKFYPVASVGYYQNSFNLVNTPSNVVTSVIEEVTFPAFSVLQDNNERLKSGYRIAMAQVFFWICPLYVFAGVLATPLFRFLFTDKWLPAVPYFQWLCIVGIFQPLIRYNSNIIAVKGRSDIFLRLQIICRVVTIVAIIAVFPLGIKALLVVQALSSVFSYFLFGQNSGKFIHYPIIAQLKDLLPIFLLSIGIGIILWFQDFYNLISDNILRLLIGMSLGVTLYLIFANVFHLRAFSDFKLIFKDRMNKLFKS